MRLNLLCIGDIVGRPGRRILSEKLRSVVEEHSIDCVIANAIERRRRRAAMKSE